MSTTQTLNFVANILALISVAYKTYIDIFSNKRLYNKAVKSGEDPLDAAVQKRQRSDYATTIAFLGLTVSYILLIIGVYYGK